MYPDVAGIAYLETARHRAEIPKNLVPVLAAIAVYHRIDPTEKGWETRTVEVLLQALYYQGITPAQLAGLVKGQSLPSQPRQPASAPVLSLM
ncbi:hypothetical protein AMR42_14295 [Limnothrix sp. PR1529]|uniref:hypothetical protein n=1 Tax=Limnothrix sp. PR1529 TaxID=1704291 RepID=UPI00081E0053|nr:hypothetical protein [Limnothrix sp. PR1529]OCQ94045.1 hypothetical protein BCR12_05890 [Limnothrix sp. P13C2]PIB07293.1 hypothetical protein AMR42_14295 [Limnothrix sp. PR1529]